jgi:hypothetical protein
LGDCAPSFAARADPTQIKVVVTFTDDEGRGGSVEATTTATGNGFVAR